MLSFHYFEEILSKFKSKNDQEINHQENEYKDINTPDENYQEINHQVNEYKDITTPNENHQIIKI